MMTLEDRKTQAERLAKLKRKATEELAMIADATAHNIMVRFWKKEAKHAGS